MYSGSGRLTVTKELGLDCERRGFEFWSTVTVEPLYKGHLWNEAKVATTQRRTLKRGTFGNKSGDTNE